MPKKNLLAFLLLLSCMTAGAQSLPSDSILARVLKSDVLLPLLIDSALKNSPEIHRARKNVRLLGENLQLTKKGILNNVSMGTSYGYGTGAGLTLGKDPTGLNNMTYFSSEKSSHYGVSVGVQLSLGAVLTRKNTIRAAELQFDMAEDEVDNVAFGVKQQVIKLYQDVKLTHSILLMTGKMKQSVYVSYTMAEKNFMNAQMSIEQFSTQQNQYYQSTMEYENKLNGFQTSLLVLEAFTGVKLAKLIQTLR